jgi:hypothetical protein
LLAQLPPFLSVALYGYCIPSATKLYVPSVCYDNGTHLVKRIQLGVLICYLTVIEVGATLIGNGWIKRSNNMTREVLAKSSVEIQNKNNEDLALDSETYVEAYSPSVLKISVFGVPSSWVSIFRDVWPG